ncbi:hypothetical protein PR048_010577 [Dryococelus australis]|uniref:Uncharacterized protein n=1 Tax=Dryococelus australis TaxID=614101 RepID=A0ABQ9I543_9NEOP|nr:hypothetical protein PR048_010577 [Dryococelus australis]
MSVKRDPRENLPARFQPFKNWGATSPGIEPGAPRWEVSSLTTTPPRPPVGALGLHISSLAQFPGLTTYAAPRFSLPAKERSARNAPDADDEYSISLPRILHIGSGQRVLQWHNSTHPARLWGPQPARHSNPFGAFYTCGRGIGKFREFNDLYGIRKVFPCNIATDSEAARTGIINCDPIAKLGIGTFREFISGQDVYTEVDFVIGSPMADLQGNKSRVPYWQARKQKLTLSPSHTHQNILGQCYISYREAEYSQQTLVPNAVSPPTPLSAQTPGQSFLVKAEAKPEHPVNLIAKGLGKGFACSEVRNSGETASREMQEGRGNIWTWGYRPREAYQSYAYRSVREVSRQSIVSKYGSEMSWCAADSRRTRQQNGVTDRKRGATPFDNRRLVTHSPAGSPANGEYIAVCDSQSDAMVVPRASRSQSDDGYAHFKGTATPSHI